MPIVNEKVSVGIVDSQPKYVVWKSRNYTVLKVGLHYTFREGRILYHIFSVLCGSIFMKLKLDTENLHWRLEEVADAI